MAYDQYGYDTYSNPAYDFSNIDPNTGQPYPQTSSWMDAMGQPGAQPSQTSSPTAPPPSSTTNPAGAGGMTFSFQPVNPATDPNYKEKPNPGGGNTFQYTPPGGGAADTWSTSAADGAKAPAAAAPAGDVYPGTQLPQDPRFDTLVSQLMQRAGQSLQIDPTTDSVIRPQVDAYQAQIDRSRNKYLDQMAEGGSPYGTGALDNAKTQTAENAGIAGANLQSSLMGNELNNRRTEIQNALSETGSLLTASQQMKLQEELGLLDASLKKQQIQSTNDQFTSQLGLNAENQNNYWNAVRSGQILG